MAGNEVEQVKSAVPDLVRTPALDIGADDVVLPRIKIGHSQSKLAEDGLIKPGDLYSTLGQEDTDPVVYDTPLEFYVLAMRRGKSFTENGELQRYDYDDPDAPAKAWVTYDYTLAVPSEDAAVPYKMLFTKGGRPAALQLNTVLGRSSRPFYENAFELTLARRENAKGKWWVPRVKLVEGSDDGRRVAAELLSSLTPSGAEASMGSGTDTPEI